MRRLRIGLAGVLVLAAFAAGGCSASVSVGKKEVSKDNVEKPASLALGKQLNLPPPNIKCPGGVEAKVGATVDCELTAGNDPTRYPVHIAVDSVKNGDAHFNIDVGKTPIGSSATTAQ